MTTIAYRDGVLAADTLVTSDGFVMGFRSKVHRVGRLRIGGCGSTAAYEGFRSWVSSGMRGDWGPKEDFGNTFVLTSDGLALSWCSHGQFMLGSPFWALGSGDNIAAGAMRMGATAEEAVRAAIGMDTRTGGEVTVLRP